MTITSKKEYRESLARFAGEHFARFHITVELPPGRTRREFEHHIREFDIRMNRVFLGRNWYMPENAPNRMQGMVSFEEAAGGWHAHMLVKPPAGTDAEQFAEAASHVWTEQPNPSPIYRGRPVTGRSGKIYVQTVNDTTEDRLRVARYDVKRVTLKPDDGLSWNFIDQMAALRRRRQVAPTLIWDAMRPDRGNSRPVSRRSCSVELHEAHPID